MTRHAMGGTSACDEHDEGAKPIGQAYSTPPPPWLADARFVRHDPTVCRAEIELVAVYSTDPDDPNRTWSQATPVGKLTLSIDNPAAQNYVEPGAEYRVTIERIRGPRGA